MKETRLINSFSEKILIWKNGPFRAQKLCIYITLGPQEEFCTMKRANRQMKVITMVCTQKWAILGLKMALHNSGSALRIFKKIFRMKNWGNVIFLTFRPLFTVRLAMVKLSQPTVNQILKQSVHDFFHDYYWILKQEMIRILKQGRHDFSGKHLCDGYCMDIM